MIPEIDTILSAFSCDLSVAILPLGQGNINATYLVNTTPRPFVLQRLSEDVFPDPVAVMDNFEIICKHLRGLDHRRRAGFAMAEPVYTKDGSIFFQDKNGGYWRGQRYVETATLSRLKFPAQARSVGRTLGRFHLLFHDLHLGAIKDPLPGFHHLHLYLEEYDRMVNHPQIKTGKNIFFCHQIIESYREQALSIERARGKDELSLQPIHGDPKIDNFIFSETGEAVGLLDLDTVGAGVIYHDLGDCLRSACSTSHESGGENVQPRFDLNLCEGVLEGYFSCEDRALSQVRPDYIYDGVFAICFELGVRFFTDHLKGNIYFRVQKMGDNVLRALSQFRLCQDIVRQESEIRQRIEHVYSKRDQKV